MFDIFYPPSPGGVGAICHGGNTPTLSLSAHNQPDPGLCYSLLLSSGYAGDLLLHGDSFLTAVSHVVMFPRLLFDFCFISGAETGETGGALLCINRLPVTYRRSSDPCMIPSSVSQ